MKNEKWLKGPKGPFRAFKTLQRNNTAAQRFSVYHIPHYHDKNLVRDNATKQLMCFADGKAVLLPDAWVPNGCDWKGTDLDPEINLELDATIFATGSTRTTRSPRNTYGAQDTRSAGYASKGLFSTWSTTPGCLP